MTWHKLCPGMNFTYFDLFILYLFGNKRVKSKLSISRVFLMHIGHYIQYVSKPLPNLRYFFGHSDTQNVPITINRDVEFKRCPSRRSGIPQEMLLGKFSTIASGISSRCIENRSSTYTSNLRVQQVVLSPHHNRGSDIYLAYDRPSVHMLEIWLARSGISPLTLAVRVGEREQ
jgi:hypothetical protein